MAVRRLALLNRWTGIALAMALNSVLIFLPQVWWLGASSMGWREILFLVCANCFCLGDLSAQSAEAHSTAPVARDPKSIAYCRWTGCLVLVMYVASPLAGSTTVAVSFMAPLLCGATLIVAGSFLRFLAIQTLGSYFESEVNVRRQQPVVRHGVYSVLRHPSECGTLLATLGAAVFFANGLTFAIWLAAVVPLIVYRVLREDQCLRSAFGEPYRDYAETVSRLIPGLY